MLYFPQRPLFFNFWTKPLGTQMRLYAETVRQRMPWEQRTPERSLHRATCIRSRKKKVPRSDVGRKIAERENKFIGLHWSLQPLYICSHAVQSC